MDKNYWHKQASDEPLYPDLLWSRPENRQHAGKLLIIGGNLYGFAAPAEAYQESLKAGVGAACVLLPDATKTHFTHFQGGTLEMEFAPSTPSGSFSQKALVEFLQLGSWADSVLLAGDLGRNSETAILLEKFAASFAGQLVVAKDAADYFTSSPQKILERPDTTLVISLAQLQKLARMAKFPQAFTFGMDLLHLVDRLHKFTQQYQTNIIVKHLENIIVAANGQVSTTKLATDQDIWRVKTAAHASVWWLQNPGKTFEALTTAVYESSISPERL
jgi:NAD(P)H-hydrate repair Nnr-like enzyme with NAD(P)H-hydrate dehydratase domain